MQRYKKRRKKRNKEDFDIVNIREINTAKGRRKNLRYYHKQKRWNEEKKKSKANFICIGFDSHYNSGIF